MHRIAKEVNKGEIRAQVHVERVKTVTKDGQGTIGGLTKLRVLFADMMCMDGGLLMLLALGVSSQSAPQLPNPLQKDIVIRIKVKRRIKSIKDQVSRSPHGAGAQSARYRSPEGMRDRVGDNNFTSIQRSGEDIGLDQQLPLSASHGKVPKTIFFPRPR